MPDQRDDPEQTARFRGCLLGLAAGDAVGTTAEFQARGTFPEVTDMTGGGVLGLRPGQWTDDTSMALCLATSLVERAEFDARDQMERYSRWYAEGYLSSTGTCVDIGNTVRGALEHFQATGDPYAGPTDPRSAGNGCIMRLAPVPIFYFSDMEAAERYAAESSKTTHGTRECVDACRWLSRALCRALAGASKEDVLLGDRDRFSGAKTIEKIAQGAYRGGSRDDIRGSGYVVECLEAAVWCFDRTDSFEEAVLEAVNLGDDADTTGAVCGQIAGAFYGEGGIPEGWLDQLAMRAEITELADRLRNSDRSV